MHQLKLGGEPAEKGEPKVRLIKMFGLAAIAAVAAMAFIGASTASATTTALCKVNEDPCNVANQLDEVHAVNVGTLPQLLSSLPTVLCLSVLAQAAVDKGLLGNPLHLQATLSFTGCGTNAAHSNCTVTVLEQPALNLLKTAANKGTITADPAKQGVVELKCTLIGVTVDCDYSGGELTFPVTGATGTNKGQIVANATPAKLTKALGGFGFVCPENSTLDGTLESLTNVFISS